MAEPMLRVENIVQVVAESDGVNVLYMNNRDVVRFNTTTGKIHSVVKLPSAEEYTAGSARGAQKNSASLGSANI